MIIDQPPRRYLYLATRNGQRVDLRGREGNVPSTGMPEAPLDVLFVGLSEEEQRAALAAFPGGARFRLTLVR